MPVLRNPGNRFVPDARNRRHVGRRRRGGHCLPERCFGGVQVGGQLHARHVQRFRDLIEVISLAILREDVPNIEVRKPQNVSQVLFILVAIHAAHRSAAVLRHVGTVGLVQQRLELPQDRCPIGGGEFDTLGWHLALFDAVVNAHPAVTRNAAAEIETQ